MFDISPCSGCPEISTIYYKQRHAIHSLNLLILSMYLKSSRDHPDIENPFSNEVRLLQWYDQHGELRFMVSLVTGWQVPVLLAVHPKCKRILKLYQM